LDWIKKHAKTFVVAIACLAVVSFLVWGIKGYVVPLLAAALTLFLGTDASKKNKDIVEQVKNDIDEHKKELDKIIDEIKQVGAVTGSMLDKNKKELEEVDKTFHDRTENPEKQDLAELLDRANERRL
jgi:flagellar motility protein MotE (MotC chaperone)